MLLRLRIKNWRSIRELKELTLVPSALKDGTGTLIDDGAAPNGQVLPLAILYGANASGKSNVLGALTWMCSAIAYSHSRGSPEGGVPRRPFALDPKWIAEDTEVDADFIIDGTRFHYGFTASNEVFRKEWLYAFPNERRQLLFDRDGTTFEFGRSLRGRNRVISDLTRPNSLYLSAAAQNAHEELTKISNFFRDIENNSIAASGSFNGVSDEEITIDRRVIEFLSKVGTGIIDYRVSAVEVPQKAEVKSETKEFDEALDAFRSSLDALMVKLGTKIPASWNEKHHRLELAHKAVGGTLVYFNLNVESDGTRRLLKLLGPMFKALDEGSVCVVDELGTSLHTQACEALLQLFLSKQTNPKGAQLITTTHDTNLLRCALLRRDQIWFTEKDDEGATDLYPLTDFRTRMGDNLEKGYLQGRYGAVPFSGPLPPSLLESLS